MRRHVLMVSLAILAIAGCSFGGMTYSAEDATLSQTTKTTLETTDTKVGTGTEARTGRRVAVHYTGWLYHPENAGHRGRQFDSSRGRGEAFEFTLGAGEVIPGWDQGVAGMKVGGTRTLVIPASLAYGSKGAGGVIPPNATLVFDVELMAVR